MQPANSMLQPEPPQPNDRSFKDNNDRSYEIKITIHTVTRLKREIGLDLFASADGDLFNRLAADTAEFCDLIWALIRDQAAEYFKADHEEHAAKGNDHPEVLEGAAKSFWESMDDTTLDAATWAFFESLIAFFREDKRGPLRLVLQKMKKAEKARLANAQALAESPKMDQLLEATFQKEFQTLENSLDKAIALNSVPPPGGD
ncbi:hypothetical protein C5Y96_05670 [Blastopirellula marina]|uniref:Uncharacterized protein n=1 Tax=Blastopirellula marina TaxID=124 RepID=A0A2S8G4G3_9BACT|nr:MULTISPECIES: hypothetical protein [Pirellulaceae]PQO39342.1 hypothetical protein C5Y96_05670 [Blastopirellula marina]RCS55650.1 hypothetical protein DTL36_05680 [Bremerella cremea]